jgi:AraC-like DNA-binding protein
MNPRVETDIIGLLRHIVFALKAFAKMHEVDFSFQSDHEELVISYDPEEITGIIIRLVCRIIAYSPPEQSLLLEAETIHESGRKWLVLKIHITGINLSRIGQIIRDIKHPVDVQPMTGGGTSYLLEWPFDDSSPVTDKAKNNHPVVPHILPNFYAEIRRNLQSHFTKTDNLIAALSSRHPKDAAFLQRVKVLILSNIDKDGFNANHLSGAMGMSRAQLYRRLQPIIRQAPAHYIQTIRIQKAKELLETTDLLVGEVAFKTGFQTPSHFTRIFIKHYGVRPSIFCRKAKM